MILYKIRRASKTIIFRIFVGIIVLAFIAWGINDVLGRRGDIDIVKFKTLPNITKTEYMMKLQHEKNHNEHEILDKLIQDRLLSALVKVYDIHISDDVALNAVKNLSYFQNEKAQFDLEAMKNYLKYNKITEHEYIDKVKDEMAKNLVISILANNTYTPLTLTKQIATYMSEERTVDIVSMEVNKFTSQKLKIPEEIELREFYKNNQSLFKVTETRDVSYIMLPKQEVEKKITISHEEIEKYLKEHYDVTTKIKDVEKEIKNALYEQKFIKALSVWVNILEEEVAAGSSLEEIANKFMLTIDKKNGISREKNIFPEVEMFDIGIGEISYPIELKSHNIILLRVDNIYPDRIQNFEEVREKVKNELTTAKVTDINIKILEDFINNNIDQESKKFETAAKKLGINVTCRKLIRKDLGNINDLPSSLLADIFSNKKRTQIFLHNNNAIVGVIKKISINTESSEKFSTQSDQIKSRIKDGYMEELISYLRAENVLSINYKGM